MKEKLVEEWLIRAGERGGIDQAFAQWLTSIGHEILWLGHSPTEFGKDIISIDPDGVFHAYQMKDEDLNLNEIRKINAQITELIEIPPVHPRVPAGSTHTPHLVTSGLFNEQASQLIRAKNDKLRAAGKPELEVVDRKSLVPRFVKMSDSFWPERPANIRDFFSFYLADGKGDFEPKKFSAVLLGLLDYGQESNNRISQRLAAVGLLGNYLLNPFEREKDHWSLFQGWLLLASHIALIASQAKLPKSNWVQSFRIAKDAAAEQLIFLSLEGLEENALRPQDYEFDDYTRSRNLVVASCISAAFLLGKGDAIGGTSKVSAFLNRLAVNDRLFFWGESATAHFCTIQWTAEIIGTSFSMLPHIRGIVSDLCHRNNVRSDDQPFEPPHSCADDILTKLFDFKPISQNRPPRAGGSWTLKPLVHFLARRGERRFLEENWRAISKIEISELSAPQPEDNFKWQCDSGKENQFYLNQEQSWKLLTQESELTSHEKISSIFSEFPDFLLMFLIAYPHRLNADLLRLADSIYRQK